MKKSMLFSAVALFILSFIYAPPGFAQEKRLSPAATAKGTIGKAHIKISYSSPSVKNRKIWGELVPYGEVWRAGANEATTFETDQPVKVQGNALPAGKYALFAIPGEKTWTIIFNKTFDQWGAFKYDEKQDALRVTVTPVKAPSMTEHLVYLVKKDGIVLRWENLDIPVSVK